MKSLFALLVFSMSWSFVYGQTNYFQTSADSDPAAVKLLDGIRKKYDAYQSVSANFTMDIILPGQPTETQRGTILKKGENVRFKLGEQEGIINAEAAYVILHGNKEVQINNLPEAGEEGGILTPQSLFDFYQGENYVLAIQGKEKVNGKELTNVELKPVDRDASEFTKLRILVNAAAQELTSVEAFSRDGSRFAFLLENTKGNVDIPDASFVFSKKDFPGYYVEDLRY